MYDHQDMHGMDVGIPAIFDLPTELHWPIPELVDWFGPRKFEIAPEKWCLGNDPFLLWPGPSFQGQAVIKLQECFKSLSGWCLVMSKRAKDGHFPY